MLKNLLWQINSFGPVANVPSPFDFSLELNLDFARKARNVQLTPEQTARMQEMGYEKTKILGFDKRNPYIFEGSSYLVSEFHLAAGGLWLSMQRDFRSLDNKNPIYCSHNTDTPKQACALLSLFHTWIYYSDVFVKD